MHATPHLSAGIALSCVLSPNIALPAAFFSHYLLDLAGEADIYKTSLGSICFDILLPIVILLLFSCKTGNFIPLLCAVSACMIDIIDKFLVCILKKQSFFACHKQGYPITDLSILNTKVINFICFLFIVLFNLLK